MHEKEEIKQHMTRADAALIGICLLAAAALAIWFAIGRRDARTLRISWDGATMENFALPLERSGQAQEAFKQDGTLYCLMLYTEGGIFFRWYEERPDEEIERIKTWGKSYNLLAVSGERVWMEAADCRDQVCVHHIPVSAGGESIICLPNRLVVEIVDEAEGEKFDEMVQ